MPPQPAFTLRKARILEEISSPGSDASPKGSIDVHILPLMEKLNAHERVVTTSSCSGRLSVFLEGTKKDQLKTGTRTQPMVDEALEGPPANARIGGKGVGGKWLFVSHDLVDISGKPLREISALLFGTGSAGKVNLVDRNDTPQLSGVETLSISSWTRLVHLKFEPMILHVLTSDLATAHALLKAALAAGFRESGIMNPGLGNSSFPMLAIRCNGLAMDSIIGVWDNANGQVIKMVDDSYLTMLIMICNERFEENKRRIDTLSVKIEDALFDVEKEKRPEWEDKEARMARKREEGLRRQRELRKTSEISSREGVEERTEAGMEDIFY